MARLISFFDGAQSSTTPTIGNIVASNLVTYPDDATFEATELGAPVEGNIYYNTTLDLIRYYNGTAWISIVDESSTQTIENKTIDGTDATGNNTVSIDSTDASYDNSTSGLAATDAQGAIDEVEARVDINETNIAANSADIDDLETLSGSPGATDHGTFTGTTISDNETTKGALQELETAVEARQLTSEKDQPNGYAGLDGSGKLSTAVLPASIMQYQGAWDANTNTPTLADGVGDTGDVYRVTVAGTQDLGSGSISYDVGDWVTYNGTIWEKQDNIDQVTEVNGQTGSVTLDADDIDDAATTHKFATQAQLDKVDFITITQAVDLDTVESDTAANNAKVSADGSIDTHSDVDTTTVVPTDGQALIWNNADSEWQPGNVAASGGEGSKNYIDTDDSNFENGVSNWITYKESGADYEDGIGGSPSLTIDVTSTVSEVLEGTQSLEIIKPASDISGEGTSVATLAIDRADQGKVLFINISADFSNATSYGDWEIRAYDITNSEILYTGTTEARAIANSKGLISVPVYLNSDTASIRVSIHCLTTDTTAYSVFADEVKLGPAGVSFADFHRAPTAYTPTFQGFGTVANVDFYYYIDKSILHVYGTFTGGTPSASEMQISLPNSYTVSNDVTSPTIVGRMFHQNTAAQHSVLATAADTYINIGFQDASNNPLLPKVGTGFLNNGATNGIFFSVPVEELRDSQQILNENELALRTIRVTAAGSGGTSITANVTNIDFTEANDPFNSWNGTQFTCPKTATYNIKGFINLTAGTSAVLRAYIDAAAERACGSEGSALGLHSFSWSGKLNAGEVWSLRSDTSFTLVNSLTNHYIEIEEVPDFTLYGVVANANKTQTKYLTADQTTDGTMSDLTFSNLQIGQHYEIFLQGRFNRGAAGADNVDIQITHDAAILAQQTVGFQGTNVDIRHTSLKFKATATTLTFVANSLSANSQIDGNSTTSETFAKLTEINTLIETNEW